MNKETVITLLLVLTAMAAQGQTKDSIYVNGPVADLNIKHVSRRQQSIEGPKVYLKKTMKAHHFEGGERHHSLRVGRRQQAVTLWRLLLLEPQRQLQPSIQS